MRNTIAKLKGLVFKGPPVRWAQPNVDDYVDYVVREFPELGAKIKKLRFAKFQ
jgi:hypothetical protein